MNVSFLSSATAPPRRACPLTVVAGSTRREATRAPGRSTTRGLEVLVERGQELLGGLERRVPVDEQRQVLGHLAALDRADDHLLELVGELGDGGGAVELPAVGE